MLNRLLAPFRNTTGLARWILVTGIVITIAFVVMAVFAPWIAPLDFNQQKVDGVKLPKLAPPSDDYWFGTSDQFYDVFSRVIWGRGPRWSSSRSRCSSRSSSASRSA